VTSRLFSQLWCNASDEACTFDHDAIRKGGFVSPCNRSRFDIADELGSFFHRLPRRMRVGSVCDVQMRSAASVSAP